MCLIIDSTGIQRWANHSFIYEADFFSKLRYRCFDFQIRIFVQMEVCNAKS